MGRITARCRTYRLSRSRRLRVRTHKVAESADIDYRTERADRVFVEVDRRFDVSIIRLERGIEIRVYPRTDGELWDEPFVTFDVDETEIMALEEEMAA